MSSRFAVIETERLSLRPLDLSDDEFILELLNEPGFLRYIGDKGVRNLSDAREYIVQGPQDSYARHGFGLYAVSLRVDGTGAAVGICGLVQREGLDDPDVGFAFLSRHWSKGYAAESAAGVLEHGRKHLNLVRIVAITAPKNQASIAVLERIGLKFERLITLKPRGEELKLFS